MAAQQDSQSLDELFFWDQPPRLLRAAAIPVNSMYKLFFQGISCVTGVPAGLHPPPAARPSLGKGDGSCSRCQPLPTRILSLPRSRKKIHNNSLRHLRRAAKAQREKKNKKAVEKKLDFIKSERSGQLSGNQWCDDSINKLEKQG